MQPTFPPKKRSVINGIYLILFGRIDYHHGIDLYQLVDPSTSEWTSYILFKYVVHFLHLKQVDYFTIRLRVMGVTRLFYNVQDSIWWSRFFPDQPIIFVR